MINANNYLKVIWTRDDFLQDDDINDQWLCNPEWQICPSVVFIGGYPKVLTCENHNDGSNNIMIHPCWWKHNLPYSKSDQIGDVVVQPKTVQCVKAGKYTNECKCLNKEVVLVGSTLVIMWSLEDFTNTPFYNLNIRIKQYPIALKQAAKLISVICYKKQDQVQKNLK